MEINVQKITDKTRAALERALTIAVSLLSLLRAMYTQLECTELSKIYNKASTRKPMVPCLRRQHWQPL